MNPRKKYREDMERIKETAEAIEQRLKEEAQKVKELQKENKSLKKELKLERNNNYIMFNTLQELWKLVKSMKKLDNLREDIHNLTTPPNK